MKALSTNALALLLLIGIALAGCSRLKETPEEKMLAAFADARDEVQEVVADSDRAARADGLILQLQERFSITTRNVRSHKDRLIELNADYNASRDAMAEQLELIVQELQGNQKDVLALGKELNALLTPEEREEISKARSKALDSAVRAIDAI